MRIKGCLAGLLIGAVWFGPSYARMKEPTLQDRQQAACYDDVQRLCGEAMPSVDKVTACMADKRPLVSAKCSAMWDVE